MQPDMCSSGRPGRRLDRHTTPGVSQMADDRLKSPPLTRRIPGAARSGPRSAMRPVLPEALLKRMQAAVDAARASRDRELLQPGRTVRGPVPVPHAAPSAFGEISRPGPARIAAPETAAPETVQPETAEPALPGEWLARLPGQASCSPPERSPPRCGPAHRAPHLTARDRTARPRTAPRRRALRRPAARRLVHRHLAWRL